MGNYDSGAGEPRGSIEEAKPIAKAVSVGLGKGWHRWMNMMYINKL